MEFTMVGTSHEEHNQDMCTWTERDELVLNRGVDQLELLDRQLSALEYRQQTAEQQGQTSYSCQLLQRINGVRYARAMFYEFCRRKSTKLIQLQQLEDEQTQMKEEMMMEE